MLTDIITEDGSIFNPDTFLYDMVEQDKDFLGYQIINKITGRLFPSTQRFEVYSQRAANNKIKTVDEFMREEHSIDLKLSEYHLVPVSDSDFPSGFHIILDDEDWREIF